MKRDWIVKYIDKDEPREQVASFSTFEDAEKWIDVMYDHDKYDNMGFEVVEGPFMGDAANLSPKHKVWVDASQPAPDGFMQVKSKDAFVSFIAHVCKNPARVELVSVSTELGADGAPAFDAAKWMYDHGADFKLHVHGKDEASKNKIEQWAKNRKIEVVDDITDVVSESSMLTEGKHWPEDYEKTAFNLIKQSAIGQQSWYTDDYIKQDVKTFVDEFTPLSHKSSNLGFFMAVIRWFIEYSGTSAEKYKEFIERKLDSVIAGLLKIRNDKSYDLKSDLIKKMPFADFMKLVDEVNAKTSATTDVKASDAKFKIIPIYSYEELHEKYGGDKTGYKGDSEWCHTNGKSTYDSWTNEGTQMFFVIEREGWKDIKEPVKKPKNCYDEYGMSLIAILVDVRTNKLLNSTSRWNHVVLPASGAADTMFDSWEQLNKAVGLDVEKTCRDECREMKEKLDSIAKNANEEAAKILRTVDVIDKGTLPDEVRKAVTNVVVPDNITRIGDNAFSYCTSLTSVIIPDSIQTIGNRAFSGCTSLQSVTIPDSIQTIGYYAFYYCTSLSSVTIPDSVQTISYAAFSDCTSLKSVTISDGVKTISDYVFYSCSSLSSVTIPDSVQQIGDYAFYRCTSLSSITIPDRVQTIGDNAFYICTRLSSVTIPDSVQTIGHHAFSDCTSLKDVFFKGKTLAQVQRMNRYPWGIRDTSIIHGDESIHENKCTKTISKKYTKNMLTEGKHWPEDYEKTAFNLIKQSAIGQQSWYTDDYIKQDVKTFVDEFTPLSHKNSNLGFFMAVIRWFIEYSGTSKEKYKEFIERKLDGVIAGLLKIRNDKSYDAMAEKIKKMPFADFMKLVDEVNSKTSATTDVKASDAKYKVIPIYSYEELHDRYGGNKTGYKRDSEWCHTNGKSTYDSWTKSGTQMFFVIERDGWQKIKAPAKKPKNCYDQYGMSLIAILVDVMTNKLLNSTSRWNHVVLPTSGAADTMFESWEQLNKAVGIDVEKICRDGCRQMKEKLDKISENANEEVARIFRTVDVIDKGTLPDEVRKAVTNVVVPDNITRIGNNAFSGCTSLQSVTILDGVQTISDYAFSHCTGLKSVTIGNSVRTIGYAVFFSCSSLTSVTIPDSVQEIGGYAFYNCTSLTSITIPHGVQKIGSNAFFDCTSLSSVTIPDSVQMIGVYAFLGCTSLTSVTIPDSVQEIGGYAFYNCTSLTSITIPDGVQEIGNNAFFECISLSSVTIPDSVQTIGRHAFSKCTALTSMTFKGNALQQIKQMKNYPWGIRDKSIIHGDESITAVNESKEFDPAEYIIKFKDTFGYRDDYKPSKSYGEVADQVAQECALRMPFDTEAREVNCDAVMLLVSSQLDDAVEAGKTLGDFMMKSSHKRSEEEPLLQLMSKAYIQLSKLDSAKTLDESVENAKIWIDDIRPAPQGYIHIKSVNDFIDYITEHGIGGIQVVDIDHDAGDFAADGGDYVKCLDYLESMGAEDVNVRIHSANPAGVAKMRQIVQKNGWNEVYDIIDECFDNGDYESLARDDDASSKQLDEDEVFIPGGILDAIAQKLIDAGADVSTIDIAPARKTLILGNIINPTVNIHGKFDDMFPLDELCFYWHDGDENAIAGWYEGTRCMNRWRGIGKSILDELLPHGFIQENVQDRSHPSRCDRVHNTKED